mgnify:CR=1 FL=1
MKIKMLTLMSGPQGTFHPGAELEMEPGQAQELIAGNYAVEISPPRKRGETAMLQPPENAMLVPLAETAAPAESPRRQHRRGQGIFGKN